jgi:ABC-2 type transport system permease protein
MRSSSPSRLACGTRNDACSGFSSPGLLLGTGSAPQQIGLMFSVIVAPMIFFGCAYYPWQGLSAVPAMKWAVLVNPLVYVAEGLRATLTPGVPPLPPCSSPWLA